MGSHPAMISTASSAEKAVRFITTAGKYCGERFADILFIVNDAYFGRHAKVGQATPI
jgi:hypothetical protein